MRMFIAVVISTIVLSVSTVRADSPSAGQSAVPRVWVQPFGEANNLQSPDWITRTLHQSLVDELASEKDLQLMQSDTRPGGAQYVVIAQIQRAGGDLRVTGQVIDASTNKSIGGFKATGDQRGLFAIEDQMAQQINSVLPRDGKPAVAAATTQPVQVETPFAPGKFGPFAGSDLQQSLRSTAPLTAPPAATPTTVDPPVYTPPTYPTNVGLNGNPYGYGYGGYGYGYGYGWPNVIIINGGHGGGNGGGGGHGMPSGNGQAIRAASGYGGQAPPPGVITTIGR